MSNSANLLIPGEAEAARALENPARQEAAGRSLSSLLKEGGLRDVLATAIAELKAEARLNGLTDQDVESELAAWEPERRI